MVTAEIISSIGFLNILLVRKGNAIHLNRGEWSKYSYIVQRGILISGVFRGPIFFPGK